MLSQPVVFNQANLVAMDPLCSSPIIGPPPPPAVPAVQQFSMEEVYQQFLSETGAVAEGPLPETPEPVLVPVTAPVLPLTCSVGAGTSIVAAPDQPTARRSVSGWSFAISRWQALGCYA